MSSSTTNAEALLSTDHSVGEQVVLKGTGRHWSGVNYPATVVDVTPETIKVRYADGGYKRFSLKDFEKNLVKADGTYKFSSYELDDDHYDPTAEAIETVGPLRNELNSAIARKDFLEAHKIKQKIHEEFKKAESIRELNHSLLVAVNEEDFLKAHSIQQKIQEISTSGSSSSPQTPNQPPFGDILYKAMVRAAGGGAAGAIAMALQVTSLMWMRTTMNYQYRYGTSTLEALRALYRQGGVVRFYRGLIPALIQGPLSRFGDTAANTGVLALFNAYPGTQELPVFVKTSAASGAAAIWRIFLMPVDTIKTTMQVEGKAGFATLMTKSRTYGPSVFYHGSLAASAGTFAGHFPWFFTYNLLDSKLPKYDTTMKKLGRNAFMGFVSSAVSDTVSNSIRVVKTYRQTHPDKISYPQAVRDVVAADGVIGLFGRGLQTRIIANGLQGLMFSVLWKYFEGVLAKK